jgi:hypothetical protein
VYNIDDTGVFLKCTQTTTKGLSMPSRKIIMERLSGLLCANPD